MRTFASSAVSALAISAGLALALASWPQSGRAQSDRDFVFTDEEGHLIIRFVGAGNAGLDEAQAYEISNQEFSRMVHDRMHADLQFQDEPRDPDWAASIEPQIVELVKHIGIEFADVVVACRAQSCRLILEQPQHWVSVSAHQDVLEIVQDSLEAFIAANPNQFERAFMITAYYQENTTSHIKAFVRRAERIPPTD